MKTLNLILSAAITLLLFATTSALANEQAKPNEQVPAENDAVKKLKALGHYLHKQNDSGDVAVFFGGGGPLTKPHSAEAISLLPQIPNLIYLTFYVGNPTLADLQSIAAAPRLKSLTLLKGSLPDDAAKALSTSASIERLVFDRGLTAKPFGDADLAHFAKIKTLKSLELRFPVSPTAKGLKVFAESTKIEELWITNAEFDDECLKTLAPLASSLRTLALNSRKMTPDGWQNLGQFTKVESLWLMDSSIDGRSMGGISKLNELRSLVLARSDASDEGMKALAGLKKLKALILSETKVTDEGLKHLENMTSLVELQVGNSAITAKGIMYLGKSQGMGMVLGRGSKIADADMPQLENMFPNSEIVSGNGLFNGTTKKGSSKDVKVPPPVETPKDEKNGKLPKLPGRAPVFAIVTKVDKTAEKFNFFLLFDEIVNTEKIVEDEKGIVKKRTADRVMTSLYEEKTDRPLKGSIVSTGEGKIIPLKQAMEQLPGKLVIICDDFEGLHPTYRKMLAKDTWIIEIEKPKGLRVDSPQERLEALKAEQGLSAKLFVEIKDADKTGILVALETDPVQAGKKYQKFVADLNQRIKWLNHTDREHFPPSVGELSLVMLAAIDPRLPKDSNFDLEVAYRAIHQAFKPLLGEPKPRAELLRELLKAWMKARLFGTREYAWMAQQYGLRELAPELVRVVLDLKINTEVRYSHLWPLADLGGEAELEWLARLLNDAAVVDRGPGVLPGLITGNQSPQQWRDVVLGVLVRKSGEKMADYGFKYPNEGLMPTNPGIDFVFPDDETRQKGLAKWKARKSQ